MKAMTLRLPDDLHDAYRREAFEQHTSITALMLDRLEKSRPTGLGCDVCGAPPTPARPGGMRLCPQHSHQKVYVHERPAGVRCQTSWAEHDTMTPHQVRHECELRPHPDDDQHRCTCGLIEVAA